MGDYMAFGKCSGKEKNTHPFYATSKKQEVPAWNCTLQWSCSNCHGEDDTGTDNVL